MKYYDTQINWKGIGDYLSAARILSEHGSGNTSGPRIHCQGLALELAFKFYLWDKNGRYPGTHNLENLALKECQNINFSEQEINNIKSINKQYLADGELEYPARYRPVAGRAFLSPSQDSVEAVISKIIQAIGQLDLLGRILNR